MTQFELPFDDDLVPEASSPGYLTIAEAAKIVRCYERTIRRAIDRGALRAGRVRGANAARTRPSSRGLGVAVATSVSSPVGAPFSASCFFRSRAASTMAKPVMIVVRLPDSPTE